MSIKFWDDVGEVELVDEVEWWDIFFVVFRGVVDSWGRGRWRGDLFDERHSGLGVGLGDFWFSLLGEVMLGFIDF